PAGDGQITVISPSTEEVVGRVPDGTAADVDRAVAAARVAFEDGPWPRLSVADRAAAIWRVVDELGARAGQAVEVQIGPRGGTRQFTTINMNNIRPVLERMLHDGGSVRHREVRDGTLGKVVVMREPVGVAAGITPWNAPVMVAVSKLFPSLLMGCPMVLKPAP